MDLHTYIQSIELEKSVLLWREYDIALQIISEVTKAVSEIA